MKNPKFSKKLTLAGAALLTLGLAACAPKPGGGGEIAPPAGDGQAQTQTAQQPPAAEFNVESPISVVSREDGSGTRSAFISLFGIEEKAEGDGTRVDRTTPEAIVANKTDVMLTTVAEDPYAVGYVSIGSLSPSVKALPIDGAEPTDENVKNGSYAISRPFLLATKGLDPAGGAVSPQARDFISYILSKDGQAVVGEEYISVDDSAEGYAPASLAPGKVVVAGSSSVTPLMEELAEKYMELQPDVEVEVQQSDSTSGITGAIDGTCDIGMSSRELTDDESARLTATNIATDGIAVIVNPANTAVNGFSKETVRKVFTGEAAAWKDALAFTINVN
ncbi:MAG: substrate-binding domain-containing protein [Clostridiales bacterium]|nr:substrate-binding domain-containing protein [Clostridiales bacterium]